MMPVTMLVPALIASVLLSLGLRGVLACYYGDRDRILIVLKLRPADGCVSYYKPMDNLFAPLPFVYCWLDIASAVLVFRLTSFNAAAGMILVLVAAGRMRALQEVGHNALHCALCPSKALQWFLSNTFFQFPMMKRDMTSRFIVHVKAHHPNADIPGMDPNLTRIVAGGMAPGMTSRQFFWSLLAPLSPHRIAENFGAMIKAAIFENSSSWTALHRILTLLAVAALYTYIGGPLSIIFGYLIPLISLYPVFAWISLLSKHRWHTPYRPQPDRHRHDYEHGHATDFTGLCGPALRYLIFPMSDAYHLAHHIFPYVRAEYLPAVDRELKVIEPRYTQYISDGLLGRRNGQPGALADLHDRLVKHCPTIAPLAAIPSVAEARHA